MPTDGSTCTFAIQTVVCGNITGNVSDPITITFYATETTLMVTLHSIDNQDTNNSDITQIVDVHSSATNTVYIISFTSLATALIVGAVLCMTVVAIILKMKKAKITAMVVHSNRAEGTIGDEQLSENVTDPLPSVNTQDNVAYGHTRISTKAEPPMHDEPMYEDVAGPLSSVNAIDTQGNVAYSHTKTTTLKESQHDGY